jgi:hypothetical protein
LPWWISDGSVRVSGQRDRVQEDDGKIPSSEFRRGFAKVSFEAVEGVFGDGVGDANIVVSRERGNVPDLSSG